MLAALSDAPCPGNAARWKISTALDVCTEVLIFGIPVCFVSKDQIQASKKRVVAFVFSFRLIVAAFSIATTTAYLRFLDKGASRDSIGVAPTVAWMEVLLCTSVVSASVPGLRSFLWDFMSRGIFTVYGVDTSQSRHGDAIPMPPMSRAKHTSTATRSQGADASTQPNNESQLRPEWLEYMVNVASASKKGTRRQNRDSGSVNNDGSKRMMIHGNVESELKKFLK